MYWFIYLSFIVGLLQYSIGNNADYNISPHLINYPAQRDHISYQNRNKYPVKNGYNQNRYQSNKKYSNQSPNNPSLGYSNANRAETILQPTKTHKTKADKFSQNDYYSKIGGFGTNKFNNLPLPTPNLKLNQYSQFDNNAMLTATEPLTFLGLTPSPTQTRIMKIIPTSSAIISNEEAFLDLIQIPSVTSATSATATTYSSLTAQSTSTISFQPNIVIAPNITIVVVADKEKSKAVLPSTTSAEKQRQSESTAGLSWTLPWKTYF
ncbi:hypothetical protein CONCODRAFT_68859 [Conidiobolus coronatus NRRL 28638]|uniref:Uncharacterized protein n=1 Tax=Conidiobolus coronatus (strain ATCC 28846 / CBS 209.66 / NRRL 28638) TaxID=796925 RepID=A0A137PCD9_CONC2|nr:hypothetical protein CONCODRAFT_68859 [Conidiobolus coronatus NRRL 28638]|eukprot:KXN72642.1 hypothetical protein CONCODRAFT_68859 [Conidiobolus coronatus NRRL 28638]